MRILRLFALVAAALAAAATSAQPPEGAGAASPPPVVNGAVRTDTANSRVHVFLVFDDNDLELKPDLDADDSLITQKVRGGLGRIAAKMGKSADDLVTWRPSYRGANVTAEKIFADIAAAPIGPTDTVFFFYGGHGAVDATRGHVLTLTPATKQPIIRSELVEKLRAKNPALLILCTDSCSPTGKTVALKKLATVFPPDDRMLEGLFLKHRGVVDINSSAPGQLAWGFYGSDVVSAGGVFTQAFGKALDTDRKKVDANADDKIDWNEFYAYVAAETEKNFQFVKAKAGGASAELAAQKNQTIWTTTLVPHLRVGLRAVTDPASKEVRIAEVFDGRPAKTAGLAAGDVVLEVGGRAVTGDQMLGIAMDNISRDRGPIVLKVRTGTAAPRDVSIVPAY